MSTMSNPPRLESAIPAHLAASDGNHARHEPGSYQPPYPSFSARFGEDVDAVVMAYFGLQTRTPGNPAESAALAEVAGAFASEHGPLSWDRARYVDSAGYTTTISIAYWDDPASYERWSAVHATAWLDPGVVCEGIGTFLELLMPSVDRFETVFSASDRPEGIAAVFAGFSGQIEEHAYWGAMRDRLPVSQRSMVPQEGSAMLRERGIVREVIPHNNACLIRSGQDIEHTGVTERAMYENDVEPVLRAGMDFLRDDGREIGCYDNRYMTVLDDEGRDTDRTFGMSWWNDLAQLESWAKSHRTHVEIFGAAMRHLSTFGPDTRLRLYHEVTVPAAAQQRFVYVNCHDQTGMLKAVIA